MRNFLVLMIFGISAVVFLAWFLCKHGHALQILIGIYSGKIQVKTNQRILIQPKSFAINNAGYEHSKVYKAQREDEECQTAIDYLMNHYNYVKVHCDFYLDSSASKSSSELYQDLSELCQVFDNRYLDSSTSVKQSSFTSPKPVGRDQFVQLISYEIFDFLKSENTQYISKNGTIIYIGTSEPFCLFLQNAKSVWSVASNKDFQKFLQLYKKSYNFKAPEMINQYAYGIYFLYMPDIAVEQPQEEKKPETSCPNPDILEQIEQIDEKLEYGMKLNGISNSQWNNVVRPNLMDVVCKKKLNENNKTEFLKLLHQISENIKEEENNDYETEATLQAVRAFLVMNGCLKE
jgi:hypothetical protein